LKVDDGLRGHAGDSGGADVLQPNRQRTESFLDATELGFCLGGPSGVVVDDANRRIEVVVQRWVSLETVRGVVGNHGPSLGL
jgi:hypothetical protein